MRHGEGSRAVSEEARSSCAAVAPCGRRAGRRKEREVAREDSLCWPWLWALPATCQLLSTGRAAGSGLSDRAATAPDDARAGLSSGMRRADLRFRR